MDKPGQICNIDESGMPLDHHNFDAKNLNLEWIKGKVLHMHYLWSEWQQLDELFKQWFFQDQAGLYLYF